MRIKVTMLVLVQAVVAVVAIAALILTVTTIQTERERSALDSCYLLRGIVQVATPPTKRAAARAFIHRTALSDCHRYTRRVQSGESVTH